MAEPEPRLSEKTLFVVAAVVGEGEAGMHGYY